MDIYFGFVLHTVEEGVVDVAQMVMAFISVHSLGFFPDGQNTNTKQSFTLIMMSGRHCKLWK